MEPMDIQQILPQCIQHKSNVCRYCQHRNVNITGVSRLQEEGMKYVISQKRVNVYSEFMRNI
jgi:hypothetical protein